MSQFPVWILPEEGSEVFFLIDKDIAALSKGQEPSASCLTHDAIRQVYPWVEGTAEACFPCPIKIAAAIRAGEMDIMMKLAGLVSVFVDPAVMAVIKQEEEGKC